MSPSQYPHEQEGLDVVRSLLPDEMPFRAWSGFEFRDQQGKWHEVDLLVLGRRRLHLVELKYYSGVLTGDDLTWRRDGHRAEDSPLKLARRKAQRLASKLQEELVRWAHEAGADSDLGKPRSVVPFVQEAVFLHHRDLRCELSQGSRVDLFGLDGATGSGLPGISSRLLEPPPTAKQDIGPNREDIIVSLMARIGAVQRRRREAGSWVIEEEPLGEGDGWQDWPAFHAVAETERARIRFFVTRPGAAASSRAMVRRVAEHEYQIMSRLANDRLLRPRDMVQDDLGVGLVYDLDDRFHRLDLWLTDEADSIPPAGRLSLLRQVAEVVAYAHDNRVVHRGLTPHAVLVRRLPEGNVRVLVGDWQSAGALGGAALTGLPSSGITGLMGLAASEEGAPAQAPAASPGPADVDRQWAETFQAPEGVWNRGGDRIRLDVFALGALTHFLLCGRPAAPDLAALRERVHRDNGIDLARDLPGVMPAVRSLVLEATRPAVSERLPDVRSFIERLNAAEESLAGPAEDVIDPLEATPRSVIGGRFRLERRLGAGSTAVGLLVTDRGSGEFRVLKVAVDDAAAVRLADEARVLAGLDSPRLVRLVDGPVEIGGRQALVLENAGEQTLAEVLHRGGRLRADLLQRWGGDLLEAVVALDRARVEHRDIKPANLGVREDPGDRQHHLVLFDFSLTGAEPGAVTAGTPPYLDPFLDSPGRSRYDQAAERYAAAVVLFEMATGVTPRFGDGLSHPASVPDEAAIEADMFEQAHAEALPAFFRTALTRDARQRHASAEDMLSAWRAAFTGVAPAVTPGSGPAAEATRLLNEAESIARAIDSGPRRGSFVRDGVLAEIAPVLARVDPARAEHLARGLGADRAAALARVAATVADADPAGAVRLFTDAQYHAVNDAHLFRWPFPEVQLVRRQVIRAVAGRRTLTDVTRALGPGDPAAAARLLDGALRIAELDEDLRDELLAGIAAATTLVNADRAEQIARGIACPEHRAEALGRVASALAGTGQPGAERIASSLADDPAGSRSTSASWAARALVTVAEVVPPGDGHRRQRLLAEAERLAYGARSVAALIKVAAAADDQARALRLLADAEQLARHGTGRASLHRVVLAMASVDLARAEQIARGLAEPAERAGALARVAVALVSVDASRAAQAIAEAEHMARTATDELVGRPEALTRVAVAAAVADPARAEPIARGIIDGPASAVAHHQAWAARALASVGATWLGHGADAYGLDICTGPARRQ